MSAQWKKNKETKICWKKESERIGTNLKKKKKKIHVYYQLDLVSGL